MAANTTMPLQEGDGDSGCCIGGACRRVLRAGLPRPHQFLDGRLNAFRRGLEVRAAHPGSVKVHFGAEAQRRLVRSENRPEHALASLCPIKERGVDRRTGANGHHGDARMKGEQFAGGGNFAFGEDAEHTTPFEHSRRRPGGGGIASGPFDGDRVGGFEDPAQPLQFVIFASHHPDDRPLADRLDQQGVKAAGVIADQDNGARLGSGCAWRTTTR